MQNKTVSELRALARKKNVSGYSRMRKSELISAIKKADKAAARKAEKKKKSKFPSQPKAKSTRSVMTKSKIAKSVQARKKPKTGSKSVIPDNVALEAEQRVEDAKYITTPPGGAKPIAELNNDLVEDLDNLPQITAPRLSLLPQKPGVLHAYWTLQPGFLAQQPELRIRLSFLSGENIVSLQETKLTTERGHWYFHTDPSLDAHKVYLQLGYYDQNNAFVAAIERGIVHIPHLTASTQTDQRWWISEQEFHKLYIAAGGQLKSGQLSWPTHKLSSWQSEGGRQSISSW